MTECNAINSNIQRMGTFPNISVDCNNSDVNNNSDNTQHNILLELPESVESKRLKRVFFAEEKVDYLVTPRSLGLYTNDPVIHQSTIDFLKDYYQQNTPRSIDSLRITKTIKADLTVLPEEKGFVKLYCSVNNLPPHNIIKNLEVTSWSYDPTVVRHFIEEVVVYSLVEKSRIFLDTTRFSAEYQEIVIASDPQQKEVLLFPGDYSIQPFLTPKIDRGIPWDLTINLL